MLSLMPSSTGVVLLPIWVASTPLTGHAQPWRCRWSSTGKALSQWVRRQQRLGLQLEELH